jgi:putative transposase
MISCVIADGATLIRDARYGVKERKSSFLWDTSLYNGSNGHGCGNPITPWSPESRMHSERCMSGSERGYGKPMAERSRGVRNLLLPYIPMRKGFIYLVAVMDWYSRYVVSWKASITLDAAFCVEALEDALAIGIPEIFNTDQGSQFTSNDFTTILKNHTIMISMDGKGRVFDNIFIERLWRTVKYEEVYLKDYANVWEAIRNLRDFFQRYNEERLHSALGNRTPYEVYYGAAKAPKPTPLIGEGVHLKYAS